MAIKVTRPADRIVPDKILYVGGKEADVLPDSVVPLVARNCLRIAIDQGCAEIVIKRGRWRHRFLVSDLLKESKFPVTSRARLGPSLLQVNLLGSENDTVRF